MVKKWITKNENHLSDYRIFKTKMVHRESQISGKSSDFFTLEAPNWITVVPELYIDGVKNFVLVKQYRHGSDSITLEFPAGMVDEGEDLLETAKRELLEETGYKPANIKKVSTVNPNPAFMTNSTSTFVAKDLKKIAEQNLDEHEEIEIVIMPVDEFDSLVGGDIVNSAITIQAYYFYLRSLNHDK